MKNPIEIMLSRYSCQSLDDYKNALKEIIQEIALLGLYRSKFFERASFYGGTALRIFHQLERFSEDLDFSLLTIDPTFKLEKYNEAITAELEAFGFETEILTKEKEIKSNIDSVLLKANTKLQLLNISAPNEFVEKIHHQNKLIIKMEVDTHPPLHFETEAQVLLNPIPFEVNLFQLPDLFATKIHAILCRKWQTRIKGRDWFDFVWYLSKNIPVRLKHLEARLFKNEVWTKTQSLEGKDVSLLILKKIEETDFEAAKSDVKPFIKDQSSLELWSKPFFSTLLKKLTFV